MCEPAIRSHDLQATIARLFLRAIFFSKFLVHFVVETFTNVFFPAADRALAHLLLKTYLASTIKTN